MIAELLASLRFAGGTRCPQRVGNGPPEAFGVDVCAFGDCPDIVFGEGDPPSPKELIPADLAAFVLFL